ncbi:MAG: hypothetical protein ACTSYC_00735 [Promethearchaeota archaeon]
MNYRFSRTTIRPKISSSLKIPNKTPLISQIIKDRFGIHRGIESPYAMPNSLEAIKSAVDLKPVFVEFDVIPVNGDLKTAHPPQKPLNNLSEILSIFNGTPTFPKIDFKLKEDTYKEAIDKLLELIKYSKKFVLINLSGIKKRNLIMDAECYLANIIMNYKHLRMNLDLARYRPPRQKLDTSTIAHLKNLADVVHSISLEIYEEDWDLVFETGINFGIKNFQFWLRGWPDVPHPKLKLKTILKALELEKKFNVSVYFDINPNWIKGPKKSLNQYYA